MEISDWNDLKCIRNTAAETDVDSMKNVASFEMYARITSRVRLTLKIENVRELRSVYLVCFAHIEFCISFFFFLHLILVLNSIESKIEISAPRKIELKKIKSRLMRIIISWDAALGGVSQIIILVINAQLRIRFFCLRLIEHIIFG